MLTQRQVYAAMIVAISMMVPLLWMPSMLGAIAQAFGLRPPELSHIAFAELIGFVLGTFVCSAKSLGQLRPWVLGGCALLLCINVALAVSVRVPAGLLRFPAGMGAGFGFGYGLKVCAMSARPTRSFGIFTGSMSIAMIVGFTLVAHLIDKTAIAGVVRPALVVGVIQIVFAAYAALAPLAAVVYWTNRPAVSEPALGGGLHRSMPSPRVLTGLLAIGLAFIGQGGIWAFLQTLGMSHGYSITGVAGAMSAFAIMGVVGSFGASVVPTRIPRWAAMAGALLALLFGLYALYVPRSLIWYAVGCGIGGIYWNIILPLILGLLARIDESGNGAVLGGTMSSLGSGLGPLAAGLLIRNTDYRPVGWMTALLCLASLGCTWLLERRSPAAIR